jgi:T-complex protein 1 subunit delta
MAPAGSAASVESFIETGRKQDVRLSNMTAAKSVADAVRTSLGPRCVHALLC